MGKKIGLSKSRYCKGVQCPKMLWLEKHMPEEKEDNGPEAVFRTGNMVGDLARGYFGEYTLVEYKDNKKAMCLETEQLLAKGEADNIAEASFGYDGLYCAVDILRRNGKGWDIVEVKSSTSVHDVYVDDMSFQYYLLTKCGIKVKRVFCLYINNEYVFHKKLELKKLFILEEHTDECKAKFSEVERNIEAIRNYADIDREPVRDIGEYCSNPYECEFTEYCWRHIPDNSVFEIANLKAEKKWECYHKGIVTFADVLDKKIKLSDRQLMQVETAAGHKSPNINRNEIKKFLQTLSYPLYHLDFETFQLAVPEFEGCRPYEQIPFQYSLHIEGKRGKLEHREFLAKEGTDPRRALAESLCRDIPENVCSLAYNMSFEKGVIKKLAEQFPDLHDHLMNIRENMHDLMVPFREQQYYCEAMEGSYSIKKVLPALYPGDPELDYGNLEQIQHGDQASEAFATLAGHTPEEIAEIRKNLLKYCCLDTFAMVKVLRKLKEL